MKSALGAIESYGGGLESFSRGYEYYGFNRVDDGARAGIMYREWLPSAARASLVGDFNGWDREAHPMNRDEYVSFIFVHFFTLWSWLPFLLVCVSSPAYAFMAS